MTKTQAFTKGMLRSLDTFGAGRQDQKLLEESRVLSSTTPRDQMRERWVRAGQYPATRAWLVGDGVHR